MKITEHYTELTIINIINIIQLSLTKSLLHKKIRTVPSATVMVSLILFKLKKKYIVNIKNITENFQHSSTTCVHLSTFARKFTASSNTTLGGKLKKSLTKIQHTVF